MEGEGGGGGHTPVNHFTDCNGKIIFLSLLCTKMYRYFIGKRSKIYFKVMRFLLKILEIRIFLKLVHCQRIIKYTVYISYCKRKEGNYLRNTRCKIL
jgi:hypothetical protein